MMLAAVGASARPDRTPARSAAPARAAPTNKPPCQPAQSADACTCPNASAGDRAIGRLPRCIRTAACDRADMASAFENRADAAFAIILDHNKTRVRYWYRFDPFESYAANMHLTMRLVLSLKEAGTTLPILLLPSGGRHEGYEAALTREGVTVVPDALDGAVFAPR